ncbi:MAG: dihydroorotase [Dehalococcoidia bacterium]
MKDSSLLIKNARIIDPATDAEETGDILIAEGKISKTGNDISAAGAATIDASGLIASPGFIDLHCHLRQPGYENKETIATGAAAAARGGYTTICCMPNTNPPLDNAGIVNHVRDIASRDAPLVRVLPVGCITGGRAGRELVNMAELASAGCIGFSDDGSPVSDTRIMSLAMENAAVLDLPIIDHCEDINLSQGGHMNDGWVAVRLGLKGIPAAAEEIMVARDIALCELTGARLHVTHMSTAGSTQLVRDAKQRGLKVTCDVTPHNLTLTHERVMKVQDTPRTALAYDTNTRVNPPLRSPADIEALIRGIMDGTIDAIATDHAPHTIEEKLCEFENAISGISGFETAFGVLMSLVHTGSISLKTLLACLTAGPAKILQNGTGTLRPGAHADITLLDTEREWTVDVKDFLSKGRNTPFNGCKLKGLVVATISGGCLSFHHDSLRIS